jgi:hypothetical protein
MAIHMVAGIPDHDAAAQVTDYFRDDGIDGFAVAVEPRPTIYLVQAKWSARGTHSFNDAETKKLVDGFAKLQHEELDQDNRLHDYHSEIHPLMITPGASIVLVFATSGHKAVSPTTKNEIAKSVARLTKDGISVDTRFLLLDDFVKQLETRVARRGVTVFAPLLRNRSVDEQYPALQGTIRADELGRWYLRHGRAIFDDNVRVEMDSDVNNEIIDCLRHEPENFWYFNNGVTALCEHWQRAPTNGREVPYKFVGLRIVNGAQTVSSIGQAMRYNPDTVANAQVPIRFVALDTEGPRFGARIAYATNRANPLLPRDFLAMDHVQQRLRDEFTLTWRLNYAIRANDQRPTNEAGCSVVEAVMAMACGRHDVTTIVEAKNDISCLWHIQGKHYRELFNDHTSVVEVWRRVRTLRMIMHELHREEGLTSEREKTIAVLGDLLIAHVVFRQLGDEGIDDIQSDWENWWSSVAELTGRTLRTLTAVVDFVLASGPASRRNCKGVARLLRNAEWVSPQVQPILDHVTTSTPGGERKSDGLWPSEPEFRLAVKGNSLAEGRRCDGGFLVRAGSLAAAADQSSLSTLQLRHRRNLRDSLGLVENGPFLRLTRDIIFESPSQAAAVLLGHNVNGADGWHTTDGRTYNQIMQEEQIRPETETTP